VTGLPTGTITLLFTDIAGSTQLLQQLGSRHDELLAEHNRLMREMIPAHRGYVVSTEGDAFFAAFKRTREAVDAATSAQRALAAHAWPQAVELRVRMAIHTGEVHLYADEYMGVDIHRCARICAAACGGQVLVSHAAASLLGEPDDVVLRDLGRHRLKDFPAPQQLFQLVIPTLPADFPPPRTLDRSPPERRKPAKAPRAALHKARKTLTVLFAELSGWAAMVERLDPEAAHGVASRHRTYVERVLARHGGHGQERARWRSGSSACRRSMRTTHSEPFARRSTYALNSSRSRRRCAASSRST
jgi:class 3 adenylate cyclase